MTTTELQALMPLLALSVGATLLMLQIAFVRSIRLTISLTAFIFITTLIACFAASEHTPRSVTVLLQADKMALVFCALFAASALLTTVLSADYITNKDDQPEEYFLLLVLSTLGACVLAYAVHVASLLLGMELLSVALYALIAYPDKSMLPLEAATKYLVLSAAASATILFGFALLYALTGTLLFTELGQQLASLPANSELTVTVAAVLVFAGLAFKLSLVPFHMWTPDVYQGAPSPVTGFLASTAKAAIFVVMLRWFLQAELYRYEALLDAITVLAILSMLVGNLLALQQNNLKRILAYSSIAHMGYLLIILVVCGGSDQRALATEAALYYLIAYTATTIAAFGLLSLICSQQREKEHVELQVVSGLFWQQPLLAGLMLVALLSLAGIPLTAGFIAKFYIFSAAVSISHWLLISSLIVGSGIGIYYYLRIIFIMTQRVEVVATGEMQDMSVPVRVPKGSYVRVVASLLIAAILLLGTVPQPLMAYLRSIL
ncbi:MAG: NADH-quinone oxidoreductase subunit N [Oceanicoccus sp.]|jgi:NADH-quinone oxidoreductase subunit N